MNIVRKLAISFSIIMLLTLGLYFYLNSQFGFKQRDLIAYNEILHEIEKDYLKGKSKAAIEREYNCKLILYKEIHEEELADAYRASAFILDFEPGGEYIGKIAWMDELNDFNTSKRGFFGMALMMWVLTLIAGYVLLYNLQKYFIKPVSEMKSFSEEIAKGNLDVPLPIHKQNLFGSFVEAFDIMREQLIVARKKEIAAEKARKELITELSHDVKTPVAVIKATCEVLDAKIDDPDTVEKVATISRKADTINQLIGNMMHANLEDLEQLDVKATEEDSRILLEFFTNLKQYGNIILDNEIPGCLVYMDRLRMEQAIDNVVGNSYKYAKTDVHVSFETFAVEMPSGDGGKLKKAGFLRIRIKDSGPGVSEEDLPLIAEKFYRGSNAEKVPGSGLGFYLVKYYMEKQGGGMEYYNDNGLTVELMLRKV